MAYVEIYKLKATIDPDIMEYSIFDYMANGKTPDPMHYLNEWSGEMHGTLPLTISGKLLLEPPQDYHGGEIKNGDIAIVDGQPYYFDRSEGSRFIEFDYFDADSVREARHVRYGWFVDITGAELISVEFAHVCQGIGVPCGYLGEQGSGGVYNGNRPFLPGIPDEDHLCFLHPQFLKGGEAREFISLLTELPGTVGWPHMYDYLIERHPINMSDLEAARKTFAPELLLPPVLRPLYKVIPDDADEAELAYLAAKLDGMDGRLRSVFFAVVEGGLYDGHYGVCEYINITENLHCFNLEPAFSAAEYGEFRLENDWEICEMAVKRLEASENHDDRFLAKHITLLRRCAEEETYGHHAAREDGGAFTSHGYISQVCGLKDIYRGVQDLPAEYIEPPLTELSGGKPLCMVQNTDLAALLMQIHAAGGEYMRDTKESMKTLAYGGTDFIMILNKRMAHVFPAEMLYHNDIIGNAIVLNTAPTPDIRPYFITVTGRENDRITGSVYELDFSALQDSIRQHNFNFTHIDAEMRDGSTRVITFDEWGKMDHQECGDITRYQYHYDPQDEALLAAHITGIRWACEENRQPISAVELLARINGPYMAQSHTPATDRFRIAPEAARQMVAQSAADVFKSYPEVSRLGPVDAARPSLWIGENEFCVKHGDWPGFEKWAKRSAGEILRQIERGAPDKKKSQPEL